MRVATEQKQEPDPNQTVADHPEKSWRTTKPLPTGSDRSQKRDFKGKNIELLGPLILIILLMMVSSLFIGIF